MAAPSAGRVLFRTEDEDEAEQALSDFTVEAAPQLTHPQRDVLVTVLAGGVSGALAKTAVAPLSRLTILYQVRALEPSGAHARMPGLFSALKQVVRQEGVASLWKGNLATMIHRVPYSAANFTTFEYTKRALDPYCSSDLARRFLAGAASGLVACTVAYPLDLVRTRLAAQRDMLPAVTRLTADAGRDMGLVPDVCFPTPARPALPPALRPPRNYRSIRHALQSIVREEGPRGLYRGLPATLAQVTPTLALNFCLYDTFKAAYITHVMAPRQQPPAAPPGVQGAAPAAGEELRLRPGLQGHVDPGGREEEREADGGRGREGDSVGAESAERPASLDVPGSLLCAAASGFFTSTITFPLDVVRKRVQTSRAPCGQTGVPVGYADVVRRVVWEQGWRGFYSGIVPEYCKVLPGMAIAFAVYEGIRSAAGVAPG